MPVRVPILIFVLVVVAGCVDPGADGEPEALTPTERDPSTADPAMEPRDAVNVSGREDYHDHVEAWIQGTTAASLNQEWAAQEIRLPVEGGARNATVHVRMASEYPVAGELPRAVADLRVEVTSPSTDLLAKGESRFPAESVEVRLELASLPEAGDYKVAILMRGGSDGSSLGDRFVADLHVAY